MRLLEVVDLVNRLLVVLIAFFLFCQSLPAQVFEPNAPRYGFVFPITDAAKIPNKLGGNYRFGSWCANTFVDSSRSPLVPSDDSLSTMNALEMLSTIERILDTEAVRNFLDAYPKMLSIRVTSLSVAVAVVYLSETDPNFGQLAGEPNLTVLSAKELLESQGRRNTLEGHLSTESAIAELARERLEHNPLVRQALLNDVLAHSPTDADCLALCAAARLCSLEACGGDYRAAKEIASDFVHKHPWLEGWRYFEWLKFGIDHPTEMKFLR